MNRAYQVCNAARYNPTRTVHLTGLTGVAGGTATIKARGRTYEYVDSTTNIYLKRAELQGFIAALALTSPEMEYTLS